MERMFMNTGKRKTIEPHTFFLNLTEKLDLKSSNKYVVVQNLSICYAWQNIRE